MSSDLRKIVILPDDKTIGEKDIHLYITEEFKQSNCIYNIHTLTSDSQFDSGLINYLKGDVYVSNLGFERSINLSKSSNIKFFLLPGKYDLCIDENMKNVDSISIVGITNNTKERPIININSYVVMNVKIFIARNVKFQIHNSRQSNFMCSNLLESGGLILNNPEHVKFKYCVLDNFSDRSIEILNILNCKESTYISDCVFTNTHIKLENNRSALIKFNTLSNTMLNLRRGHSVVFKNLFKSKTSLRTFSEQSSITTNKFEDIDTDYSTLFIDYRSRIFLFGNVLHNKNGEVLHIDRYSKVHMQNNEFIKEYTTLDNECMILGRVKFGSKLALEHNKYNSNCLNITIDTDCSIKELGNVDDKHNAVNFNLVKQDLVKHTVLTL